MDWEEAVLRQKNHLLAFQGHFSRPIRMVGQGTIKIRCINCKQPVEIPEDLWRESQTLYRDPWVVSIEIAKIHAHFYSLLNYHGGLNFHTFHMGAAGSVKICQICNKGDKHIWPAESSHSCKDNIWHNINKQNLVMSWHPQANLWVVPLKTNCGKPYHNKLMSNLAELPGVIEDVKSPGTWLVKDTMAKIIAELLHKYFPADFSWDEKSKARHEQRRKQMPQILGPRAVAAAKFFDLIPPEVLKKFYRMAVVEMHPDKGGDTKVFQEFQELWQKLQKGGK